MEICIKWTMCRTCTGDSSSHLQPLFNNAKLVKQLEEYSGILVKPDDGLPDQICKDCVKNLQSVHSFLTGCRRADAHLRSVVHRTMSSGRCFPNIPMYQDTGSCSLSKVGNQNIWERKLHQKKRLSPEIVNTIMETNSEQDAYYSSAEEKKQFDDVDLHSSSGKETKMIDILKSENQIEIDKTDCMSGKTDEDYLLVVSKCVLNMAESEVTDNESSENIITDVGNNSEDFDDSYMEQHRYGDGDTSQSVSQSGSQTVDLLPDDIQSKSNGKSVLKYEELQKEESASVVGSLTVDLRAACEPSSFPRHSCSICGNSFPNQTQLKSHLRTHRNEKNYECELCSKRFNAACNLTTHMRTHTGEKPYECTHCGRRFSDRSTHRKHERMHTNERPYACDICAKTFSLSSTLKAHFLSHSKEKPHKCLTCNKGFRLPHQLKAHERTHVHRYEVGIMLYNHDEGEYSSN